MVSSVDLTEEDACPFQVRPLDVFRTTVTDLNNREESSITDRRIASIAYAYSLSDWWV